MKSISNVISLAPTTKTNKCQEVCNFSTLTSKKPLITDLSIWLIFIIIFLIIHYVTRRRPQHWSPQKIRCFPKFSTSSHHIDFKEAGENPKSYCRENNIARLNKKDWWLEIYRNLSKKSLCFLQPHRQGTVKYQGSYALMLYRVRRVRLWNWR